MASSCCFGEPTAAKFTDDTTGRPVTVYVQRATGERKYVNE